MKYKDASYHSHQLNIADLVIKSLAKWQRSAQLVLTLAQPTPVLESSSMER